MYFAGIDLHKFTSYLTTVDSTGNIVKQENLKNVLHNFIQYFNSIPGDHITTVESTMTWYWLNDLLEFMNIPLTLAHAVQYYQVIRKYHNPLLRRKNKSVAKTIIAKELAEIVFHVLKNKTEFNNKFKGQLLQHKKSLQWLRVASPFT